MAIEIKCSCGKVLKVPTYLYGKKARCPFCTSVITILEDNPSVISKNEDMEKISQRGYSPEELFETVKEMVVGVYTEECIGSGVIIDKNGLIVTNRHVVGPRKGVTVKLSNSNEIPGKVVRSFLDFDLAFLKIDGSEMKSASFAEPGSIKVGQSVIAIGYPRGLENTLTRGVVSAVARYVEGKPYVQTDAAINPGNSGGPLFNEYGEVVGVNTWGFRGYKGLDFAIPSQVVRECQQMIVREGALNCFYCSVCGRCSKDEMYCDFCGASLRSSEVGPTGSSETKQTGGPISNCPICQEKVEPNTKYCQKCGTTFSNQGGSK